jgi:hypothetical protein
VTQQVAAGAAFGFADLVHRLGQLRFDVVAVKGDLRCRQALQRAGEVGLAHVLTDLCDLPGRSAVSRQSLGETGVSARVTARSDERDPSLVDVREHRHVILPAMKARLIDRNPLDGRKILRRERLLGVMVHNRHS